jgi:hypothetical protein
MSPPSSHPSLFPETVPGGSLIGSVNSRFAATFTLYQSRHQQSGIIRSPAPTYTSLNSDYPSQTNSCIDEDLTSIIQNLSRSKIEALVTQAWIRNIPNQSEEKLRDLVSSALRKGILNHDDIYSTCTNSFTSLPTLVFLLIKAANSDSTPNSVIFTASQSNFIFNTSQQAIHSSCSSSSTLDRNRPSNALSTKFLRA